MLKVLLGIFPPTSGEVIFEGNNLIPAEAGIDWADIEEFADHIISRNTQQFEFISVVHPSEMKENLNSYGVRMGYIGLFKLSLEDLYLKLLAKEEGHESVRA